MKLLTTLLEIPFNGFKVIEDVNVYHYIKPTNVQAPYAIWQEESDDSFYSDNGKTERTLNGILDYYTKVNAGLDPGLDVLEKAMIDMGDNVNRFGTDMESVQNAIMGLSRGNFTMLDNLKLGYGGTKEEMQRLIDDANRVREANGEMYLLLLLPFHRRLL